MQDENILVRFVKEVKTPTTFQGKPGDVRKLDVKNAYRLEQQGYVQILPKERKKPTVVQNIGEIKHGKKTINKRRISRSQESSETRDSSD